MQIIDYYGTSDTASLMIIKQVQYGASKKKGIYSGISLILNRLLNIYA